jgi:TolB-like protein
LKPSNVFLTPHGVKLLDFGLARSSNPDVAFTAPELTRPGMLTGTVKYMAPEQITGDPVDARTDVFAAGVMLFELVTGRAPFTAATTLDWLNAVLREDPPALPHRSPLDRIIHRALQRRPDDRYASAAEMAADLEALLDSADCSLDRGHAARPSPATPRVVVLPFQLLKADDEVGFLENGLPEALTTRLNSMPAWSVRSNLGVFRVEASGLAALAAELDVDHIIAGTVLRSGDQVRVTAQLVETPGGRVCWSETIQQPIGEPFALQDELCARIVKSLPPPG